MFFCGRLKDSKVRKVQLTSKLQLFNNNKFPFTMYAPSYACSFSLIKVNGQNIMSKYKEVQTIS